MLYYDLQCFILFLKDDKEIEVKKEEIEIGSYNSRQNLVPDALIGKLILILELVFISTSYRLFAATCSI